MTAVVAFEVRGSIAHFRRPDTLGTHASYPIITRTALRGLAAAILGEPALPTEVRTGVRLLSPVRTVAQELTLHGKTWTAASGRAESFHRPTSVELVVQPHYRIYYAGPLADRLRERVERRQSHYHTYLGSAFCLTFPEWRRGYDVAEPLDPPTATSCNTIVPSAAIARLLPEEGRQYARAGGVPWEHEGPFADRRFIGKVISFIYEVNGGAVAFEPATSASPFWRFYEFPEEGVVCLW